MARLDHRGAGDRAFDDVDVVHGDEERDRVAVEILGGFRVVGDDAGARLVHHLEAILLHAGEDQLAVGAGHFVLHREPEAIHPELEARLDAIDHEDGSEVLQLRNGHRSTP